MIYLLLDVRSLGSELVALIRYESAHQSNPSPSLHVVRFNTIKLKFSSYSEFKPL